MLEKPQPNDAARHARLSTVEDPPSKIHRLATATILVVTPLAAVPAATNHPHAAPQKSQSANLMSWIAALCGPYGMLSSPISTRKTAEAVRFDALLSRPYRHALE